MKRMLGLLLMGVLVLGLVACGGTAPKEEQTKEKVELIVFAAASMTETLEQIAKKYSEVEPDVKLTFNFDSSGTLKAQIEEGAQCDIFISAAQKQMDQLEDQDFVVSSTRINLLENRVALVVPEGNPKGVKSFEDLASQLKEKDMLLAMGNSDVPVGQYTREILKFFCLNEDTLANDGVVTYGTNVKEVTTQVKERSVDAGVVYCTDAYSAQLTIVDYATVDMCGQVVYPAAVMKESNELEATVKFLEYLQGSEAMKLFETVGFVAAE